MGPNTTSHILWKSDGDWLHNTTSGVTILLPAEVIVIGYKNTTSGLYVANLNTKESRIKLMFAAQLIIL